MTNKQYEHLGRAVAFIARLNEMSDAMYGDKVGLETHIKAAFSGVKDIDAGGFVKKHYGDYFASMHAANELMQCVGELLKGEKKEVDK